MRKCTRTSVLVASKKISHLTVTTHSRGDALFEPAILAAISVDAQDVALLVLGARAVLDLLLNGTPEKALESGERNNTLATSF